MVDDRHPAWCSPPCDAVAHRSRAVEVPTLGTEPVRLRASLAWSSETPDNPTVLVLEEFDHEAEDPKEPANVVLMSLRQAACLATGLRSLLAIARMVQQRNQRWPGRQI
ncbi:hypothetical protein [Plantactinospora sonchi]|uniref:Uncharacterized protein n=1 Tax=Plantactinospora sonchi TaxID=1544735 RepID=A0ABU7RWT8_9ACTN